METFGYSPNSAERVSSSGHVLAVSLVTWLLRIHPGSTPSFGLSFSSLHKSWTGLPQQISVTRYGAEMAVLALPSRGSYEVTVCGVCLVCVPTSSLRKPSVLVRGACHGENMHKDCAHARLNEWVERSNDSGSGECSEWTITRCWKATLSKSR